MWIEDPRHPRGWRWDPAAPSADPSPTRIMNVYAGGTAMPENVSRDIYDPGLGSDGGGVYADPDPLPAIDPGAPVDHVDQLYAEPGHDSGQPATTQLAGDDTGPGYSPYRAPSGGELVVCDKCGSGVHPDRLRD